MCKVGDKVLIDFGEEDDGSLSLGNGLIGEVIDVDKNCKSNLEYQVQSKVGITWYYEHDLTLVN